MRATYVYYAVAGVSFLVETSGAASGGDCSGPGRITRSSFRNCYTEAQSHFSFPIIKTGVPKVLPGGGGLQ